MAAVGGRRTCSYVVCEKNNKSGSHGIRGNNAESHGELHAASRLAQGPSGNFDFVFGNACSEAFFSLAKGVPQNRSPALDLLRSSNRLWFFRGVPSGSVFSVATWFCCLAVEEAGPPAAARPSG